MNKFELAISLLIVATGSFIAGAAVVGIQLEKVKRQRDEAQEQLQQAYDSGFNQGYLSRESHEEVLDFEE